MYKNIDRLFQTGLFNIKPGLDRINKVLDILGSPNKKVRYVIVGGTNGKGSVSTYLSELLNSSGYKTGLYTSPHLVNITERIKVEGKEIDEAELDNILGLIFQTVEDHDITLSFFEIITVSAFLWFYSKGIDIGILEVGMGGRWDATNVIDPLIAVITNVTLDHTKYLGDTVEKIAGEKAELIKRNTKVVSGCKDEALRVIKEKCITQSAELYLIDKDFYIKTDDSKSTFYKGISSKIALKNIENTPFYQLDNLAIAICCAELLNNNFNYSVDFSKIDNVISNTSFKGRFEIIRKDPLLILDGSHNEDAARKFTISLKKLYPGTKFNFLVSMLSTKDIDKFLKQITGVCSKMIITEIPDKLSFKAEEIAKALGSKLKNYKVIKDPVNAFLELASYDSPSCVCGSLYLIGHLKKEVINEKDWNNQR